MTALIAGDEHRNALSGALVEPVIEPEREFRRDRAEETRGDA